MLHFNYQKYITVQLPINKINNTNVVLQSLTFSSIKLNYSETKYEIKNTLITWSKRMEKEFHCKLFV